MPLNRDELKKVFDQLDTDGDDQVDFFELKNAKAALANLGVTLSLKELKQVFISAFKNKSHIINGRGTAFDIYFLIRSPFASTKLCKRAGSALQRPSTS